MRKRFVFKTIVIFILVIGSLFGAILLRQRHIDTLSDGVIFVKGKHIPVLVADTKEEQVQGLSGMDQLPTGMGMYFLFEEPLVRTFWMKDMHFPIDIIWIDAEGTVSSIEHSVLPDSYPELFSSIVPIQYVLEVNAGFSTAFGITVGDKITFIK